jgi:hypothetical protein
MQFICLCPTYGRPSLVRTALAHFLAQDLLTGDEALLVIFDDAGQIATQAGGPPRLGWRVLSEPDWIPLPRKYGALLDRIGGVANDAQTWYVVWDDDDVYLPWHLAAISIAGATSPEAQWSHPSTVWSTYQRDPAKERPMRESAAGRFHGALAIRGDLLYLLNGWPNTDLATYDQQQLARVGPYPRIDPCTYLPPSYVYRWGDTGRNHCSGSIDQHGRYRQPPIQEPGQIETLTPALDPAAQHILRHLV